MATGSEGCIIYRAMQIENNGLLKERMTGRAPETIVNDKVVYSSSYKLS